MTPGSLLDASEVAKLLGMSADWIYSETRAGRIPHVKLGRYRRYRRESIEKWLVELESSSVMGTAKRGGTVQPARPMAQRK